MQYISTPWTPFDLNTQQESRVLGCPVWDPFVRVSAFTTCEVKHLQPYKHKHTLASGHISPPNAVSYHERLVLCKDPCVLVSAFTTCEVGTVFAKNQALAAQ